MSEVEELELIGRAISNAINAYEKTFSDEDIEPAYFPVLEIEAGKSLDDFTGIIETVRWTENDYGRKLREKRGGKG